MKDRFSSTEDGPAYAGSAGANPVVRTRAGWVRGEITAAGDEENDELVAVWRGVPYGDTTAGEARFRLPSPASAWEGVRDATEYGEPAMQPNSQISSMAAVGNLGQKVIGTEDCLHLDVVRPASAEDLPVMVYFHGGSFVSGASHEPVLRGLRLATALNAIYISVNFRLGALGYLNVHDYEDAPGLSDGETANPAIADQVLALRWIQENATAFGGDPQRVTIVGESAGGNAVTTLMAVPAARGLFHGAIAQSAPAASVHTSVQSRLWSTRLRTQLGVAENASVDELREIPAEEIVRAGQAMTREAGEARYLNSAFSPTVDGDLLPEHPLRVFEQGEQAPVPLILGTNLDEASFSKFVYQRVEIRSALAGRVTRVFDPKAAPQVLEAYNGASQREDFAELFADAVFWAPSVQVAEHHAKLHPTWMYRFDFAPQVLRWIGLGAIHSLDLAALFGDPDAHRATAAAKWAGMPGFDEVVAVMQHNWRGFIHKGTPLAGWPEYNENTQRATLLLDAPSQVVTDPQPKRREAWLNYDLTLWGRGRLGLLTELGIDFSQLGILDDPTDRAQW